MHGFRRRWAAAVLAAALVLQPRGAGAVQAAPPPPGLSTATVDEGGLSVTWSAPGPVTFEAGPDGTLIPVLEGYESAARPGWPRVPMAAVLLAVPPGVLPRLEIVAMEARAAPLKGALALGSEPTGVLHDEEGHPVGGVLAPTTAQRFSPSQPVTLEPAGVVRGVHVARLSFYPLLPEGSELQWVTRLVLRLHYGAPVTTAQVAPDDPMLAGLRRVVLNPQHVAAWPPPSVTPTIVPQPMVSSATETAIIEVAAPGLTVVTFEALSAAGYPVSSADPAHLRLTHAAAEVAAEWEGDGDTLFEAGERLLFYAEPRFSRWTWTDTYYLQAGPGFGLRMGQRPANPVGLPAGVAWVERVVEDELVYTPDCLCAPLPPGRDGERWAWEALARPGAAATIKPISLPSLDSSQPATLTVWAIGYTNVAAAPDHRLAVAVNDAPVGQAEWEGKQAVTATLAIPAGILTSGTNTVTLTLPGLSGVAVEGAWLDAFALRYALGHAPAGASARFAGQPTPSAYTVTLASGAGVRAYDVTDPHTSVRLTALAVSGNALSLGDTAAGARRYALFTEAALQPPAALRLARPLPPVTGADYLVIAPAEYFPGLTSLTQLRQSQGLASAVVDVQAIYDAADGRPSPDAIRAYLANTYATWNPRPAYVLLVGDGTLDPKRYRSNTVATVIPPFLADVDPWAGETAADNRYATVDGPDNVPDMLIGRLPVNSLAETQSLVDKIVNYERAPYSTGWNAAAVFVADDADAAGDHPAQAQGLAAAHVADPFEAHLIAHAATSPITATRQAVLDAWNAGAGAIVYAGHASTHQWAAERLFHDSQVALLHNGTRPAILLALTCFTGSFHMPGLATLDEALVRHPTGGAVAAFSATGLGVSTGHAELGQGFLEALYDGHTLGAAALAGKLSVAAHRPDAGDLLDTFGLLGDPATHAFLGLTPWPVTIHMPVLNR